MVWTTRKWISQSLRQWAKHCYVRLPPWSTSWRDKLSMTGTISLVSWVCKCMCSPNLVPLGTRLCDLRDIRCHQCLDRIQSTAKQHKSALTAFWMLTEGFLTLLKHSSNRINQNRSAKATKCLKENPTKLPCKDLFNSGPLNYQRTAKWLDFESWYKQVAKWPGFYL